MRVFPTAWTISRARLDPGKAREPRERAGERRRNGGAALAARAELERVRRRLSAEVVVRDHERAIGEQRELVHVRRDLGELGLVVEVVVARVARRRAALGLRRARELLLALLVLCRRGLLAGVLPPRPRVAAVEPHVAERRRGAHARAEV